MQCPPTRMPTTPAPSTGRFGTFGGVFTPSTLTILGVIMFLRFGYVVGQAGIWQSLIILLLAKTITTLTAFSLSAVATNTRVKGGGAYYLISRSLGVEFGGGIGVVFFLAQAVSVAMYVIGFTEALLSIAPSLGLSPLAAASIVNLLVFICVYIGAGWTIKVQYGILAVLALALVSFFGGAWPKLSMDLFKSNWNSAYLPGNSFFTTFALFFPAVTGIMAGVNMSGDLKSPSKSIPSGTLWAIAVTAVIYLGMALVFGAASSRASLQQNTLVILDVAFSPVLIYSGIFAATLSSALGSMMGAPRILQALARDRIFPGLDRFGNGSGDSQEPRTATILTWIIAQSAIFIGDLNLIAPVITMFFMVTYGTLNLACFYESSTHNPSYRPRFRFSHWSSALLGTVGCLSVMLLMAPLSALVSISAMAGLYWFIKRLEVEARWGDVKSGLAYEKARRALLRLEREPRHPKNWRPFVMAFSGGAWRRNHLAEFGHWLTAGHGVLSLAQVITGDPEDKLEQRDRARERLRKFIADEEIEAFPAIMIAAEVEQGIASLTQTHGIGGLTPNVVMLGLSEDPAHAELFGRSLRLIRQLGRSAIVIRCPEDRERWEVPQGTVDVWWRGGTHGPLQLVLAHLLTQNPEWRNRPVRVLLGTTKAGSEEKSATQIQDLLDTARINGTPEIVVADDIPAELRKRSRSAAVVIRGFEVPEEGMETTFSTRIQAEVEGISTVVLVSSSGGISLHA